MTRDFDTGEYIIAFNVLEGNMKDIESIRALPQLRIKATKYQKRRSLDANALLWACIGEIAKAMKIDSWDVYLMLLERYGVFTYVCIKPTALSQFKRSFRTVREVGEININGTKAIQLQCFFGSSTYDADEFTVLLEGTVSEMRELGLPEPTSKDMRRAIEEWKKFIESQKI